VPNQKCEDFITLIGENDTFVCLFSAANGVGKTAVGVNIVGNLIFGNQNPDFFDLPIFNKYPFRSKEGRIVSDPTTVAETMIPELHKWLIPGRYTTSKRGKNYEYKWKTDNGHSFDVMTYEQTPKEFESKTLGWCWFDEPPPEAIYKATVARMRRGGIIFISATPLMNAAWLYDHILTYTGENRRHILAKLEDNCKKHGIRGILNHRDIKKMIGEYTEDEQEARVHGRFQHLVGLVFKNFNKDIHVIKPFTVTKRDYVVVNALDPHPRNPDAVTWMAVDRNGTKFIIDELYIKAITGELARRIHKKDDEYRVERWIADPSAFNEDQHQPNPEQATLAFKLRELGLVYERATKTRHKSDRRLRDAFDYEKVGKEVIVAPELYIFDICVRHIFEVQHYQWDEWRGVVADRKAPKEKAQDKDDHTIENMGRILIQEPVFTIYQPPVGRNIGVGVEQNLDPFA